MYTAAWNSVSSTSYMGGRELWNKKSSTADWGQITHANYCMCAHVLWMSLCTSMCQIIFPYPLLPFDTASRQHQTGFVLYCSVYDTRLASLSLHIEAL